MSDCAQQSIFCYDEFYDDRSTFIMIFSKLRKTFQEVKSSASQWCVLHSTFSKMKWPTDVSRELIFSTWRISPLTHICNSYHKGIIQYPPCDHSLQLVLTQVSLTSAHCPSILTQTFSTIFPISVLRIPIKKSILLMFNTTLSLIFSHTLSNFLFLNKIYLFYYCNSNTSLPHLDDNG